MAGQLNVGEKVASEGNTYTIKALLGAGGQGEVYQVTDKQGKNRALKWYYEKMASPEQKSVLEKLIRHGSPSSSFLWPEDLISRGKTFGYIMPLRPKNYSSIDDLVKRKVEPSFMNLSRIAFNLTKGYYDLHQEGFSYRDISFGNLFFDADTGDVLICDNDNVAADDEEHFSVYGTPKFMAPEIVMGKAKPSRNTDRFSLAVLLFYMLMINHPLEGAQEYRIHCMDGLAMLRLYGEHPVFIFDPDDYSNRPVKGYQDNAAIFWELYPDYLKEMFVKAFTVGLKDPTKRVTETEWMNVFANMISGIIICPHCHAECFYDPKLAENHQPTTCWRCNKKLAMPGAICIDKQNIVLVEGQKVYSYQMDPVDGNIQDIIGTVVSNPNDPTQLGIKNESKDNWTYIRADGTQTPVPPGRSAKATPGNTVNFGKSKGTFC